MGCSACGRFVTALSSARSVMRHAVNKYEKNRTPSNRKAAVRAKELLDDAKRYHDEHKLEHEINDKR